MIILLLILLILASDVAAMQDVPDKILAYKQSSMVDRANDFIKRELVAYAIFHKIPSILSHVEAAIVHNQGVKTSDHPDRCQDLISVKAIFLKGLFQELKHEVGFFWGRDLLKEVLCYNAKVHLRTIFALYSKVFLTAPQGQFHDFIWHLRVEGFSDQDVADVLLASTADVSLFSEVIKHGEDKSVQAFYCLVIDWLSCFFRPLTFKQGRDIIVSMIKKNNKSQQHHVFDNTALFCIAKRSKLCPYAAKALVLLDALC